MNLVRNKEIYHSIYLDDIARVFEDENFIIKLKDNTLFEFNNQKLYELLGGKK